MDFLLVHGAWHGGWCWNRVAVMLRSMGHTVLTPTLTGLGERSHLLCPNINMDTHIDDVVNVARFEQLGRFILCGHSYGGAVVTGAAERLEDRLAGILYLDALLPRDGESAAGSMGFAPPDAAYMAPPPVEAFAIAREEDRAQVAALMTPHPVATITQPLSLTGASQRLARKMYMVAEGYAEVTDGFRRTAESLAGEGGWIVKAAPCGHHVMMDAPDLLVQSLLELA